VADSTFNIVCESDDGDEDDTLSYAIDDHYVDAGDNDIAERARWPFYEF
jgi:hypothetical protein